MHCFNSDCRESLSRSPGNFRDGKTCRLRSIAQTLIAADKCLSLWPLLTPCQRRSQLQAVRSTQRICVQECSGEIPQSVVREDFSPALTQQSKSGQSAISFGRSNDCIPMKPGNCAMHFDSASPPDNRRKSPEVLAYLTCSCFLYAKRHQGAGVPESCRLAHSPFSLSFKSVSTARLEGTLPVGIFQNALAAYSGRSGPGPEQASLVIPGRCFPEIKGEHFAGKEITHARHARNPAPPL